MTPNLVFSFEFSEIDERVYENLRRMLLVARRKQRVFVFLEPCDCIIIISFWYIRLG